MPLIPRAPYRIAWDGETEAHNSLLGAVTAANLLVQTETNRVEIQKLSDGLRGWDYYKVDEVNEENYEATEEL